MFSLGAFTESFGLMKAARFVFGIGGPSLDVAQNTYASVWFEGKLRNMVIVLGTSVARIGSALNFQCTGALFVHLSHKFASHSALGWTLLIAGFTTIVCVILTIIVGLIDKKREKLSHSQNQETESPKEKSETFSESADCFDFIYPCSLKVTTSWKDYLYQVPIPDLKFPLTFWIVCLICVTYSNSFYPFVTLDKLYFQRKYNFSRDAARFLRNWGFGFVFLVCMSLGLALAKLVVKYFFLSLQPALYS